MIFITSFALLHSAYLYKKASLNVGRLEEKIIKNQQAKELLLCDCKTMGRKVLIYFFCEIF